MGGDWCASHDVGGVARRWPVREIRLWTVATGVGEDGLGGDAGFLVKLRRGKCEHAVEHLEADSLVEMVLPDVP